MSQLSDVEACNQDLAAKIVEALGRWWLRADDPLRNWHNTREAEKIVRDVLAGSSPVAPAPLGPDEEVVKRVTEALAVYWLRADDPLRQWHPMREAENVVREALRGIGRADDLGLSFDMLDVDRLREWARLLLLHGPDISHWGSVPFVAGKMQTLATDLEKAIRDIGALRAGGSTPAAAEKGTAS